LLVLPYSCHFRLPISNCQFSISTFFQASLSYQSAIGNWKSAMPSFSLHLIPKNLFDHFGICSSPTTEVIDREWHFDVSERRICLVE